MCLPAPTPDADLKPLVDFLHALAVLAVDDDALARRRLQLACVCGSERRRLLWRRRGSLHSAKTLVPTLLRTAPRCPMVTDMYVSMMCVSRGGAYAPWPE